MKNVEDIYPLSPMQQGMLFHTLAGDGGGAYVERVSWSLQGALDVPALRAAWEHVIESHPVLRTAFIVEGLDEPLQVVRRRVKLPWRQLDWRGLATAELDDRFASLLEGELERGFKPDDAPLLRLTLVEVEPGLHYFLWSYHHLLLDGWSVSLILKDVVDSYTALTRRQSPPSGGRRAYRDYIGWLRQQDIGGAEAYWRETLKGYRAPVSLGANGHGHDDASNLATAQRVTRHRRRQRRLTAEVSGTLEALAKGQRLTPNTVVQGAWAVLLARYSGEQDVVFGTVVSGRPASLAGAETMVGLFINTLPLRARVTNAARVLDWLRELQTRLSEMRAYEFSPLFEVQRWGEVGGGRPLFESIVVFENLPAVEGLGGETEAVAIRDLVHHEMAGGYPLTLAVVPGSEWLLQATYEDERFGDETVERMLAHLEVLLKGIVDDPRRRIGELSMPTPAEREQVLATWNDTAREYDGGQRLHGLFEAQVERTPCNVALVFGETRVSYQELNERANRLARRLRQTGVGAESLVGICAERSVEMVVGLLGILKAGGAYVPLDPDYPRARLAAMLEDSGAAVVLTQTALREVLPPSSARVVCLDDAAEGLTEESAESLHDLTEPGAAAYVIYTSGSTGRPKGVVNTHRGICNRLHWMQEAYGLTERDRVLQKTPYSFDVSVWEFFWPLMTGAQLVLALPGGHRDASYLVETIVKEQITTMHFVPSMMRAFLESPGVEDCVSLRHVVSSGEALTFELQERFHARLAVAALHNLYGPTEAAVDVTHWSCARASARQLVPIGRPIANIRTYLLDSGLQPVPPGVIGELHIGGVGLARGYLNRAELTAEKFIPDPFGREPGARLYCTGDLARFLPDGAIEYLGRVDNQVKVRGFRVELGEIEAALSEHASVREAVVTAREETAGDKRLVAYVAYREEEATPTTGELRRFLQGRLPDYMIPSAFVALDALPLTPSGKVDRRALPAPDKLSDAMRRAFVAPRTPTEEMVAGIWRDVLRTGPRVGVHDDFFESGGHSLLATQLAGRIRERFGVEIPLRQLFKQPTLAELARNIEMAQRQGQGLQTPSLVPVSREQPLPLSFAQQRLWVAEHVQPGGGLYNLPVVARLTGELDVTAMKRTLVEVVRRHESLRTSFMLEDAQPVQVIHPPHDIALPLVDLSGLPEGPRAVLLAELSSAEAARPFDLAAGPLLRASLIRLAGDEHVALLTMHHIVSDGWSMGVLVREVVALYDAYRRGAPSPLAELAVQYADYAVWQREWLRGEALEQQVGYWRERLTGAPAVLELPTDRARPGVQAHRGAQHKFELTEELSEGLKELSGREGATLFMTLLAAWQVLLSRYSGQDDIVVGAPVANRNRAEVEPLIGFFVNMLALRAEVAGGSRFVDLLGRVRETCLGAYAHQDVPFETLFDELATERSLSYSPIFQVSFLMQNAPVEALELPGLRWSPVAQEVEAIKFDLTLNVTRFDDRIGGVIGYSGELFDAATIERMEMHLRRLLQGIVANPEQRLMELPLLSDAERLQLLDGWNDTAREYANGARVHEALEAQAARTPNGVALTFGGQHVTYRELNRRANRTARHLRQAGVGAESRVGLMLERSIEMVVGLLGILKAGGAYVPLDPEYPFERLAFMMKDAGMSLLLTQRHILDRLPPTGVQAVCLDADRQSIDEHDAEDLRIEVRPEHLAYVIYTSGSTGRPKGVMVEHRQLTNTLDATREAFKLEAGEMVVPCLAAFSFDIFLFELFTPLLNGGRCVLLGGHEVLDAPSVLSVLEEATVLHAVPRLMWQFMRFVKEGGARRRFTQLRRVFVGGDAVSPELVEEIHRAFESAEVFVGYGPTEAAIVCARYAVRRGEVIRHRLIGKPLGNISLRLYDRHGNLAPVGVAGEIYIGGAGVTRGYLNRDELTREKYVEIDGGRFYRSGDVGRRLPDGNVVFVGRLDEQVKVRGFRVELGEIEAALAAHPAVREAVVVAREVDDGSGDKRLVAYVVPRADAFDGTGELRRHVEGLLPAYMIPSAFVLLERLPLTAHGKVDRPALPAPDGSRPGSEKGYVAPRTPLEKLLAEMWQEALGIETIGVNDNFFEFGGDSIRAVVLSNKLQEKLDDYVYVVALFDAPTVAGLASFLEENYAEAVERACGVSLPRRASADAETSIDEDSVARLRELIHPLAPRSPSHTPASKNPRAVFVLSPPRSGSTLLRVMLAGHPSLFAPPELELLSFDTLAERTAAFAGRDKHWLEGTVHALMELTRGGADAAEALMRECEEDGLTVRQFYRRMQDLLGARTLVDKTPSYALDLGTLRRAETDFADAAYIHLVRHPYGMIQSFTEARLDQVFFRRPHPFTTRQLAELIWTVCQQNISTFLAEVPASRQHRVHFEALVSEPRAVVEGMCEFLGIEFQEEMLDPYRETERRMTGGIHAMSKMLGDVKFHQHRDIEKDVAERWKQRLAAGDELGDVTWKAAELLGYPRLKKAEAASPGRGSSRQRKLHPLTPLPRDGAVALSYAQQRLWFIDQLQPGSPLYNMPFPVRLKGALDVGALRQTLTEIVRRHEPLRTTFSVADGEPVQVIHPPHDIALPLVDLSGLLEGSRAALLAELSSAEAGRPFDLAAGPLLRASLIRLAGDEHVALLTMHHIVSDGWSMGVLVREVVALYGAYLEGKPSPLPELKVQYADYAAWQREWLQGEALGQQVGYWRERLAGAPAVLELPTDHPRPGAQTHRGAHHRFTLPEELTRSLKELSTREGVTLFMTLLAGWQSLLARYTGQSDIVVGAPVANRNRAEVEPLIGFFVNMVALRIDLSADPSVMELLRQVREVCLGAYAHQDVPFEKLVEELQPARSLSHTPIFQVAFVLQNAPAHELKLSGLSFSPVEFESGIAEFDLTLNLTETGAGISGHLEYNADLFDAGSIARMAGHYERLMEGLPADLDRSVSSLPLMRESELHQLLTEWGATAPGYPKNVTIHEIFEARCALTPDAVAVVYEGQHLTYKDLNARANQLAHHLCALGVGAGSRVAVCLDRSLTLVIALLATLKAGGAYVPLDPRYPRARLSFMLADADAPIILTTESLLEVLPPHGARVVCLDTECESGAHSEESPVRTTTVDNVAYVIYTSGSTGQPKGVMVSHANVARLFAATQSWFGFDEKDVWTLFHSYSFDFSVWELWGALLYGGRLVVVPYLVSRSPKAFYELLVDEKVTVLNQTPSAFSQLLPADETHGADQELALRLVIFGGEALELQSLRPWFERHGDARPQLVNMYGITETTVHVTYRPLKAEDLDSAPGSMIGESIPDLRVRLLDKHLKPVAFGVPGELYVGGDGLAHGYLGRPALTADRFVPDPFDPQPGSRLYRTGDRARYSGKGELQYLGRLDQQVKIRGFRIELGEIEAALGSSTEVRACAVVAREDTPGEKRLVAYVVPQPDAQFNPVAARGWLRERLPEYMLPTAFVVIESLPLTPNGKLDRRALPPPPIDAADAISSAQDWRTPAEELVAFIWAEVLGLHEVGADDDFFELGGHSLLATQVVSRVQEVCGVEVALRAMFERPTVRRLAAEVESAWRAARGVTKPPLSVVPRGETLPLSYAQQRLWFIEQLRPGGGLYNVPVALRLSGRLDVSALRATLREVVRRHEVLRTTFVFEGGEPRQRIAETLQLSVPLIDLSGLAAERAETEARRVAASEAVRGFDLASGPVVRATLLRLGSDEHILLFTLHHIASDGWSMGVLVREVGVLYGAHVRGKKSPLDELPVQYADFAVWQREWLQGEELERQVDYWRRQLAGAPPVLELPTDRARPAVQSFESAGVIVELPSGLTDALKALSRREGTTLFMTLLAAWQTLLARYSGQEENIVGAPIANRKRAEIEPLIGFFVNTLALRADLSRNPTFTELLRQVRETCLGAYAHQDVPFEKLVEELHPARSLSYTPIFQVMFALQNAPVALELPELILSPMGTENRSVNFELNLALTETAGGLKGSLIYHTDLFDATTIELMVEHFTILLEGIASDPAWRLSALPLMGETERRQLEIGWNDTPRDYPRGLYAHNLFEAQAAATPEAVALISGEQRMTYEELNCRSNQLARRLQSLGVAPETYVGVCLERSVESLVALLAVFKSGGVYVPLDPELPLERLSFMVEDAGVAVLLTQAHLAEKFAGSAAGVVCVDTTRAATAAFGFENLERETHPGQLAYVIYTSGSTGRPKGVLVEHRQLLNTLCSAQELHAFNRDDVLPCIAPFSFDISLFELLSPLLVGARLRLLATRDLLDASCARRLLHEVTYLHGVPSLIRQFVGFAKDDPAFDGYPQLRQVFVGGDVVAPDLVAQMRQTFPSARIYVGYGPTEATIMCAAYTLAPDEQVRHPLVGRPLGNVALRLYDTRRNLVPVGVDGEIYIGGAGIARGYLNRAELTRERFVEIGGERYYRSGDVGRRLADGTIIFVRRADEQVKVHGFRIELGEIEAALDAHDGLGESAVMASPDESGERRLTAYVVAKNGWLPTAGELRSWLLERLPAYMIPAEFVVLDALPRTPHGKLDRGALAASAGSRAVPGEAYVEPETDAEKQIARVWQEVLGLERVGTHDNFFEAGGTSLLLVKIHHRLQQTVKAELTMIDLFKYPTVSALAEHVGRGEQAARVVTYGRVHERVKKQNAVMEQLRQRTRGGKGMP